MKGSINKVGETSGVWGKIQKPDQRSLKTKQKDKLKISYTKNNNENSRE